VILLDTHVWLWWAFGSDDLPIATKNLIETAPEVAVSTISCLEIALLTKKGRIFLSLPAAEWLPWSLSILQLSLLPLTPKIAARSVLLPDLHADPMDRVIIATALEHDADLISKDKIISSYPDVRVKW
jgi:PIN domain nuclease of toxin-antitoxin system